MVYGHILYCNHKNILFCLSYICFSAIELQIKFYFFGIIFICSQFFYGIFYASILWIFGTLFCSVIFTFNVLDVYSDSHKPLDTRILHYCIFWVRVRVRVRVSSSIEYVVRYVPTYFLDLFLLAGRKICYPKVFCSLRILIWGRDHVKKNVWKNGFSPAIYCVTKKF